MSNNCSILCYYFFAVDDFFINLVIKNPPGGGLEREFMKGVVIYVKDGVEPNLPLLMSYFGVREVIRDFKAGGNVYENTLYITAEKTQDAVDYDEWYYKLLNPDDIWPGDSKRFLIEIKKGKMWLTIIKPDENVRLVDNVEASYAAVPLRVAHVYMASILAGFEPPRCFVPLDKPAH